MLGQLDDEGREYMCACASRSLNVHERNYTPWKGELLAVVWAIKHFRVYLHGVHFELVTDHKPLLWLLSQQEPEGQHARWVLSLQEYDFHVRHRPGVDHTNADVLSRSPLPSTVDGTGARLDKDSDPLVGTLPKVVFGPCGTGTPRDLDPAELPVSPDQQGQKGVQQQGVGPSAATSLLSLSVLSDRGQAEFIQWQMLADGPCCLASYMVDRQEQWQWPRQEVEKEATPSAASYKQQEQQTLRRKAGMWVQQSLAVGLPPVPATKRRGQGQLDISTVATSFFPAAQQGLVVYEPFGGLCAGLEMVLRNGFSVVQYIYSDISPTSRRVAAYPLQCLLARYPDQLPPAAVEQCFDLLPQDVSQVTRAQLQQLSQQLPYQWLVVGGWECQDLSPAGTCSGVTGPKSSTITSLVSILADLQQIQQQLPPGYLVENTALQLNFRSRKISKKEFKLICRALGVPVCIDAAQFDSLAHRVRDWWTNLCTYQQLEGARSQVQRSNGLKVRSVLGAGREEAECLRPDPRGQYPANQPGKPLSAWPTLVAYPMSRAFVAGKQGAVWDRRLGLR